MKPEMLPQRSAAGMTRSVGKALVGTAVLAAMAGCASQESFGLPELTPPRSAAPHVQVYPGYGYGYGYGNGYGVGGSYGYPNGYPPGYGFADPFYAAQGMYPYGYYRNPYNSYPQYVVVPCADGNNDGRCDRKPPKDRDHHGNGGQGGDHDRADRPVPPRYARRDAPDAGSNTGHRARGNVAPVVQPPSAPVLQPRATPTPTTSPAPKQPVRARPPDTRRTTSPVQEP
jgi:hypothetical protein